MLLATTGLLCSLLLAPGLTEVLLALVGRGVILGGQWFGNWVLGRMQNAPAFVPAQPVLAAVNARARVQESAGGANARVALLPLAATRRNRAPLSGPEDEDEDLADRARRLKAARKAAEDESDAQPLGRRFDDDDEDPRREKKARDEEEELSDEEAAEHTARRRCGRSRPPMPPG